MERDRFRDFIRSSRSAQRNGRGDGLDASASPLIPGLLDDFRSPRSVARPSQFPRLR
jgi:hypothetical protein